MNYEHKPTVEMEIARLVSRYALLSCDDVRTAGGNYVNCGDRKLRYLAKEFKLRRQAHYAYTYSDKYYYFRESFQKFCETWLREQNNGMNKKINREL